MSMNSRLQNMKPNPGMNKGKRYPRPPQLTPHPSAPGSKYNSNSSGPPGSASPSSSSTTSSPYSGGRKQGSSEKEKDTHFAYNMTVLIGCPATVQTRSGETFEGVFVAFSNNQEIMLEAAHLVNSTDAADDSSSITTHFDFLVIPPDKLMVMKFENAQTNYATRDFLTDTGITNSVRGPNLAGDKELTPWDGGEATDVVTPVSLHLEEEKETNGWAPQDMFKKNAEKYGVVSSYSHELEGYTTSVNKSDADFKKHEEAAIQLAGEIEKNTSSLERSHVENGDDEEAKYSAVVRAEPIKQEEPKPKPIIEVAKEVEKFIVPPPLPKEQIKVEKIVEEDKDVKSSTEARVSSDPSLNINDNNNSNNNNTTAASPPAVSSKVKSTFTFNPDALEFKPSPQQTNTTPNNNNNSSSSNFTQRQGPSTPPRPPSTPASNPQVVPVPQVQQQQPMYSPYVQGQPQLVFANTYPQTISPAGNPAANVNSPRQMHPHRKPNVMGQGPRREMPHQTIQIQGGQAIITSAMPNSGGPQFYPVQYPPVRFHQTPLMYADVGGSGQGPTGYMQHNGGGNQVPTHTVNTVPASTNMRHLAQLPAALYQSGENVHVPMHYVQLQPGVGAANMTSNPMGNPTLTYVPNYFITNQ